MLQVNIKDIDEYEGRILGKTLYHEGIPVVTKGSTLTKENIDKIKQYCSKLIFNIFISEGIEKDNNFQEVVFKKITTITDEYIKNIFTKYSYSENINEKDVIMDIVSYLIDGILSQEYFLNYLENVYLLNEYLFCHVIRVTILSIILAVKAHIPRKIIIEIAIGSIVHDIGKLKLFVDYPQLMDPNHEYSTEEFEIIKRHPVIGYEEVEHNNLIPLQSKKIILFHHVWEDFEKSYSSIRNSYTSYPEKYKNITITAKHKDLAVRIVQISNYFDAMTNNGHYYADVFDKQDVIRFIKNNEDSIFSAEAVHYLYDFISIWGIGDLVELSDGTIATVVEHTNNVKLPIVKDVKTDKLINLNTTEQLTIKRFINGVGGGKTNDTDRERYNYLQCF